MQPNVLALLTTPDVNLLPKCRPPLWVLGGSIQAPEITAVEASAGLKLQSLHLEALLGENLIPTLFRLLAKFILLLVVWLRAWGFACCQLEASSGLRGHSQFFAMEVSSEWLLLQQGESL